MSKWNNKQFPFESKIAAYSDKKDGLVDPKKLIPSF